MVLDWSIRLHSGRLIADKRTQGRTAAEVRRKAKAAAKKLLASEGSSGQWRPTDPIERYLDEVSAREIQNADLRDDSVRK